MLQLPSNDLPLPMDRMRYRVAGTDDADWFRKSGSMSVLDLRRALASIGRAYEDFSDVLEWGCGCGRILRHLPIPEAPRRLCGNDIDAEALKWVNKHMPWVQTSRTEGLPPLPYPDESFDLIFNHSVMTHLDAAYQDAWLAELRRVLQPGGVLTLSVSGRYSIQALLESLPAEDNARIALAAKIYAKGIMFISQDVWSTEFPDFYRSTFHDPNYVFDHWSKFLDIRAYLPRGALDYQDMVVLMKPMLPATGHREYLDYVNRHHPGAEGSSPMPSAVNPDLAP